MTQPLDPTLFGTPTDNTQALPFDQYEAPLKAAIDNANTQLTAAQERVKQALAIKQGYDTILQANPDKAILLGDAQKAADAEYQKAQQVAEAAAAQVTKALDAHGTAVMNYSRRANVPQELKDRYAAMADLDQANIKKVNAETQQLLNAAPQQQAQLEATTKETQANTAVAQAKADVASATTDTEIKAAQARLDQANATLQSTQLANTQAGLQNTITAATAAQAGRVAAAGATTAEAQASTAAAQATTAAATAGIAPDQAQATLRKAQSDADMAALQVQQLQATLNATTDPDRRRAVQLQLDQQQAALDSANQQLEQAKKLMPLAVSQAGANVAATQQGTAASQASVQQGLLGPLYGMNDRIQAIKQQIAAGTLDPQTGMAQLQDYVNTAVTGTTPFERDKFATEQDTTRRGQDYGFANQSLGALGSFGSSTLSSMAAINKDAPAGSDALARSYGGIMGTLFDAFQQMRPNQANYPLAASLRSPIPATTPSVSPSTDNGHVITINIGSGAAANPQPPTSSALLAPGAAGTGADPNVAGSPALPAMLTGNVPAMPAHVDQLWANDPNLHPELAGTGAAGGGMAHVM